MKFKEWLVKEVGTSTGDIACFARMSIPLVRRMWPPEILTEDPNKKKRIKKQPQVEE